MEAGDAQEAGELFSAAAAPGAGEPRRLGRPDPRADGPRPGGSGGARRWRRCPPKIAEHAEVAGARSALALAAGRPRGRGANSPRCEARVAADPDDLQARYDLATALNAIGEREEAAERAAGDHPPQARWNEDAARLQLLKFFEAWGFDDPATMAARRKLSARAVQLIPAAMPGSTRGRGPAGRVPGLPAAGRAAAAARQAAAEHLRAALPGDDRGRAGRGTDVRHDPAGPAAPGRAGRAGPLSRRLPRAGCRRSARPRTGAT